MGYEEDFRAAGSPGEGSGVGRFVRSRGGGWVPRGHPDAIEETVDNPGPLGPGMPTGPSMSNPEPPIGGYTGPAATTGPINPSQPSDPKDLGGGYGGPAMETPEAGDPGYGSPEIFKQYEGGRQLQPTNDGPAYTNGEAPEPGDPGYGGGDIIGAAQDGPIAGPDNGGPWNDFPTHGDGRLEIDPNYQPEGPGPTGSSTGAQYGGYNMAPAANVPGSLGSRALRQGRGGMGAAPGSWKTPRTPGGTRPITSFMKRPRQPNTLGALAPAPDPTMAAPGDPLRRTQ